ncbi:hypothetical protein ACVWYN_000644 [Pedobacter sp. UYP24]
MKNILFSLLVLLICQTVEAQKVVSTEAISFSVPVQAVDISLDDSNSLKTLGKYSVISGATSRKIKLMKIGNMVLQTKVSNFDNTPNYLEDLRKSQFYDAKLLAKSKYIISDIKSVNNIKYFFVEYELEDDPIVHMIYWGIDSSKTKLLTTVAEFPKTSKAANRVIFTNFVNQVRFKN